MPFNMQREQTQQPFKRVTLLAGKSAGLPCRDRRDVVVARAAQRERDVLRDAEFPEIRGQTEARRQAASIVSIVIALPVSNTTASGLRR